MKKNKIKLLVIFLILTFLNITPSGAYEGLVSVTAENEELTSVLYGLAEDYDINIVISKSIAGNVTVKLSDVTLNDALTAILQPNNYAYSIQGDVVSVYSYSEFQQIERFSPLITKVFTLENSDVSSLRRTFQSMKSTRGKMELNLKGNQVIVTDTPDQIKQFGVVLEKLDTRRELKKYKLNYAEASEVIDKIAQHFGLRKEDLLSKGQSKELSFPRQIAIYFLRQKLALTYQKIGSIFKRDHSTIMSSFKNIQKINTNQNKEKERQNLAILRKINTSLEIS